MTKPMLSLIPCRNPSQILLLGAHSDDIEIGCGATILKLVAQYPQCEFVWVVFCSNQARADEARASAAAFLDGASHVDIRILPFRDGFLPWSGIEAKEAFETLKRENKIAFKELVKEAKLEGRLSSKLLNLLRNIGQYDHLATIDQETRTKIVIAIDKTTSELKVALSQKVF